MTVVYNRELDSLVYDRKLKDGPGDSMYGLEVCKALDLPSSFLERAIRLGINIIVKQMQILICQLAILIVRK